ncbi:MAG TPA: MarR family winged helix-turn-helix transcriptional regulator [Stellaceae bacterium]|nr:MarR family winged helix-turn-helix transcriptional regulator [Stellaceae bacterium]
MSDGNADTSPIGKPASEDGAPKPVLLFDRSVGYQIRTTHRMVQRALQARIEPHGVTPGMWYFLRVLWDEDGLTQRELSRRVGTMEPTTMSAIQAMENAGFVRRERNAADRRKINIYLTPAGRALETQLLPSGIDVVESATKGFSQREIDLLLSLLGAIQKNLLEDSSALDEIAE